MMQLKKTRPILIAFLIFFSSSVFAERLALVIGNNNYQGKFTELSRPIADAKIVANALEKVGFRVTLLSDLNQQDFDSAIDHFAGKLQSNDIAFIYYAGHGVAVAHKDGSGEDYLIPIGTNVDIAANLKYSAINAQKMLNSVTASGAHTVLVLDACRNNPFTRGSSRGLRFMENVGSSYIFYSASFGEEAQDDGTFARALAAEIVRPQSLDELRVRVLRQVRQASGGKQRPTAKNDLLTDNGTLYFLKPSGQAAPASAPPVVTTVPSNLTPVQAFIEGVKAHNNGNYQRAVSLFTQAAEADISEAQFNLALMYDKGKGTQQDYVKAKYWYEKAAAQGDSEAQFNLAVMYNDGKGMPKDEAKAKYWFEKAAEKDLVNAQVKLGVIYGLEENYQQSKYWFEKAAEQGNAQAQTALGMLYSVGLGTKKDDDKAKYWLKKAAAQGEEKAQEVLNLLPSG